MKKRLLAVALAGVALVGCVKNEDGTLVKQEGVKIAFDTPLTYDNSTRANVHGEIGHHTYEGTTTVYTYPKEENFVIFGVKYANTEDFAGWDATPGIAPVSFNGATVSYYSDVDGWAPKDGSGGYYYWPDNMKTAFAAYSPAVLEQAADWDPATKVSYGKTGLKIEDFQVPADAANHFDLMFSKRIVDKTSADMLHGANYYSGIPITFQHALSSIRFSLKNDTGLSVILTGITITGLKDKGTFNENIPSTMDVDGTYERAATATDDTKVNPKWTLDDGSNATYTVYSKGSSDGIQFPLEAQYISSLSANVENDISHSLLVLPQPVTDNIQLTISYLVNGVSNSKTVLLNKGEKTTSTPANKQEINISNWEMGSRYTYRLHYSKATSDKDKIYFSPETDGWQEGEVIVIEL